MFTVISWSIVPEEVWEENEDSLFTVKTFKTNGLRLLLYVLWQRLLEDYIVVIDEDNYEKEVKYMPYMTCGQCKHFIRDEKGAYGRCAKREFLICRHGGYLNRKFCPAQSRKACKYDFEKKDEK